MTPWTPLRFFAQLRFTLVAFAVLPLVAAPGHGAPASSSESVTPRLPKLADGRQRAFPTAEGFGAGAKGGRGGVAIMVTNVQEKGDGSLKACIEAQGPRTCIFRTSGTITLSVNSLVVRNPFLTIAGETAPGDGIAIRNGPDQTRPSLEIHTHDVIIRHLRLRPGPHRIASCCSGALGLYTSAARDIMIDHVSASWGSDETVDSENAVNVTLQWMLVAEPLLDGGPNKSNRARNMYVTKGGNVTVHHSLFALGKFRNPQFQMKLGVAEVVNNVHYSPVWKHVISLSDRWTLGRANIIGNYKISGPKARDAHLVHLFDDAGNGFEIHLSGNYDEDFRQDEAMPEDSVVAFRWRKSVVPTPLPVMDPVNATTAEEAYEAVLANAGATRPRRDSTDKRYVDAVRNRAGRLLRTDPEEVGGWPFLASAPPLEDSDADGMADEWEREIGLNSTDRADGNGDMDGDGWTNLEEYLHELAGDGAGMTTEGKARDAAH